jgi:hypothetical protein
MDYRIQSADGLCQVEGTYLREYRMGAFPERITVTPPPGGLQHFYYMGGHAEFDERNEMLIIWDDSDVVLFKYTDGAVYSYHGPLFGQIETAKLDESGSNLLVQGWIQGTPFSNTLNLESKECPRGLGRLSDGVFSSTPASENPNRFIKQPMPGRVRRLLGRIFGR